MKKQLLILGAAVILITGCQNQKSQMPQNEIKIALNSSELKEADNNTDNIKMMLVRKSILKEMADVEYSKEEKEELKQLKDNLEMEYFLNKKAAEMVKVTDNDILKIYQNNIDKLKDMDINEVLVQIKDNVISKEMYSKKLEYINSLAVKYDLDKKVNEYVVKPDNQNNKSEDKKIENEKVNADAEQNKSTEQNM